MYIVECISLFNALIKLLSDRVATLNSKCQVHIGSGASFKCRDDSTYTYSCQVCEGVENGGSPRSPLIHTDSHHHHHRRVSSARGLRSNFWTCLNDHRKWNVTFYYQPPLVWKKLLEDRSKGEPTTTLSDDLKNFGICLHKSFTFDRD